ncbi:MAG: DnaD domain protein [Aerococcus sp.]|nr:DnaD domain protein [Aerococcus sp.]
MGKPPWETLQLTDTLKIQQAEWLSDVDWKTLAALYLPIIGSQSYALFHALYQLLNVKRFESDVIRHTDITDTLVWPARTYVIARAHLEGIGLLDVYHREDAYQDPQWLYFLKAPVTPKAFFEDTVLSTLLYREVGEQRFKQLRSAFSVKRPQVDRSQWQETTYSFRDVYRFSAEETRALSDMTETEEYVLPSRRRKSPHHVSGGDFDTTVFKQTLLQRHIPEQALTDMVMEVATVIHDLYGYDELGIARLAYEAMDFKRQRIDTDSMQKRAYDGLPEQQNQQSNAEAETTSNQQILAQLTADQRNLAEQARAYPVMTFVSYLKESRHGYLTKQEQQLLTAMVSRGRLSQAVINVMAYYYLVELDKPTLYQDTMEATENDWLKHHIETPEQALYYLQKREPQRRKNQRKYSSHANYKEMTPQWMDQSTDKKDEQLADRTDEIRRLLNKDKKE